MGAADVRIIAKLNELYVSTKERFVMMRPGGTIIIPKIGTRNMRLADSNLKKHLEHEYAVSVFGGEFGSKFFCLDVDKGGISIVQSIVTALMGVGFKRNVIHVSTSGGKGFHVEIFFASPVPYASLQRLYKHVLTVVSATDDMVELRPTHKQAIKLPLSVHPRTGNICWFWDVTRNKPIENQEYVLWIVPMRTSGLESILAKLSGGAETSDIRVSGTGEWQPVELQGLFEPAEEGTRHARMVRLATALRYHCADAENCRELLLQWHEAQGDGYCKSSYTEVLRDINQIVRWTYREEFHQLKSDDMMIFADEMQRVTQLPRRSTRIVFFLVMCIVKINHRMKQREMCELLSLSHNTITRELDYLSSIKAIEMYSGGCKITSNGHLCKQVNHYSVPKGKVEEHVCRSYKPAVPFVIMEKQQLLDNFFDVYYGVIHSMFRDHDLRRFMTLTEHRGYMQYIESQAATSENGIDQINRQSSTKPIGA